MPTEMLLTPNDLTRIAARGVPLDACTIPSPQYPGLRVLKNVKGRCYFLKESRIGGPHACSLYPDHPTGCRYFPLIYDVDKHRCIIDKRYCKHYRDFLAMASDSTCCKALERVLRDELRVI